MLMPSCPAFIYKSFFYYTTFAFHLQNHTAITLKFTNIPVNVEMLYSIGLFLIQI